MWFDTWSDVWRTVAVGTAAYVTLVAVLRTSGKRTLAKLNAFDLVVTVAFGSTLATILLTKDVSWAEGTTAFATLAALQFAVAWTSSRWTGARSVVTARPTLLLHEGRPLEDVLLSQRVSREQLLQAVRGSGVGTLSQVAAVVLETDGSLSVVPSGSRGDGSALADVRQA
jgi:uncharacterized membrane protein YcaP (DUF421 family)